MSKIEILAPVGNEEMLRAAVFSGADAVYLGDFWGVERLFPEAYNRLGVSVVSVFTERGARAVEDISASLKLTDVPADVFERSIKCNGGYGIAEKAARKNKR